MFGTKDGGKPMTAEEKCGSYGPEHLVDWMIKYHGLRQDSKSTVLMNLRGAFETERALGFVQGQAKNEIHIHFSLFGAKKE